MLALLDRFGAGRKLLVTVIYLYEVRIFSSGSWTVTWVKNIEPIKSFWKYKVIERL